jgi:nucleoid-associated protein YgaU
LRFALFLFLIFLAVWAGVRVAHAAADAGADDTRTYVVTAGDSLWDIAAYHYGDDIDLRKVVHHIRAANGLQTSILHPGDELVLPPTVE